MHTHAQPGRPPVRYQLAMLAALVVVSAAVLWAMAMYRKGAARAESWSTCITAYPVDYCNSHR